MAKLIEQRELVKELRYDFDEYDFPVKARVYKIIRGANANFMWTISHYCKKADEATIYAPGNQYGDSIEITEAALTKYIARFDTAVSTMKNDSFN